MSQEQRAILERQLQDAKQKVISYETTLKPFRTVTDSEYQEAKKAVTQLSTEIHNRDYEAKRPVNPLDGMSIQELKDLYEKEKAAYIGDPTVKQGTGDAKQGAKLMQINTRIQRLESEDAE